MQFPVTAIDLPRGGVQMEWWSGKIPPFRVFRRVPIDALTTPVSISQPDIRLTLDLAGVIRDAALSETMAGEQLQSWIGRPWDQTVGVGGEQVGRMLTEARVTGVSAFGQVTQLFPSGRQLPIEYTAVRLGEKAGLVAIGKNLLAVATLQSRLIASQHAREQDYWKLREVETRYRLLFDASNEAVVLLQADSLRVLEVNPTAIRAFGLNPGDDFVHELARSERGRFQTMLAQTTTQGRAPGMVVHLGGDGVAWILRSSLMPSELGPLFLLQLARAADAPEPGHAPKAVSLDEFAERLPDGLLVIDPSGIVRRANPAFLDMIQANAEGAVVGEHVGTWLRHPGSDAGVMLGMIERHRVLRRLSTTLYGALGDDIAVEISAAGNTDIKPAHIGMVLRNVDRRQAETPEPACRPGPAIRAAELGRTPLLTLVRDATYAIEREYIAAALARADGNRSAAADLLGLSRQTLYMKLGRHGFEDDLPAASD